MSELPSHHEDHPEEISRVARRGLILFAIYFVLFIGFVLLNVLAPKAMTSETIPLGSYELKLGGPNLAVVYGIGLIFAAFLLALVYMRLVKQRNGK